MSAKEKFNEIGYSIVIENEYYIMYGNTKLHSIIKFSHEDMYVSFTLDYKAIITMDMLDAINQQCRELGWI